ncbi:extensin-like [Papaver somniferum]|uniref:extensin-like n=1 Tax=Papaver somniferum TaxID=3469 RepID=UPI000E6FB679|nr:extensin-like [Papaver somniferum]
MANRPRVPYKTPLSSPYRHPPPRSPDISPPRGGPAKSSQPDPRTLKTSSSSSPRVSSQKKEDLPKGSRYAVNRPSPNPYPQRSEPLIIRPLRSIAPPTTTLSQKPKTSQSTVLVKDPSSKGVPSKENLSRNVATKRKASDMSPPKNPSSGKNVSSEAAPVIRSILVSKKKKKVSYSHVDLEVFKAKHGLKAFDFNFTTKGTILLMI